MFMLVIWVFILECVLGQIAVFGWTAKSRIVHFKVITIVDDDVYFWDILVQPAVCLTL